ncbi:hypothetical protein EAG_13168 [Camponotus floridanus]|uniref:Uncharacterized protein n=1 Tax=Camponotus floridanus TaxID=104421 RepID=E2AE24_CAMFO|nr:hypothetical protein EAG_13168 [Camponotus floridanus]
MRLAIILETDRLDFDETSLIFYARLRKTHRFASKCRCHSRAWTSRPPGPGKSPWPMIEVVVVLVLPFSSRFISDREEPPVNRYERKAPSTPVFSLAKILVTVRSLLRCTEKSPAILHKIA